MHELSCPHCGQTFEIDEAGYADILRQVRDEAFDKALHERLELAEQDKNAAIALARSELAAQLSQEAAKKDAEIARLTKQFELKEALSGVERERDDLKRVIESKDSERLLLEASLKEK